MDAARLSLGTLLSCSITVSSLALADHPNRADIGIDSLSYNGPSCPPGSAASNISEDGEAFTVLFARFTVDGTATPGRVANGRCQIQARLRMPQNWTYGVQTMDFRGFLQLPDASTSVTQSTQVNLGGASRNISNWTLVGPRVEDFSYRFPQTGETIWAACHGNSPLRIVNETKIQGPGLLTVDSVDGVVALKMPLLWKHCP